MSHQKNLVGFFRLNTSRSLSSSRNTRISSRCCPAPNAGVPNRFCIRLA